MSIRQEQKADSPRGAVTERPLSKPQRVVARRMVEATQTVPVFSIEMSADLGPAVAVRAELAASSSPFPAPTINDLVVAACGRALREHSAVNSSFAGSHFDVHERVNVGIAVAVDDALFVPTVYDADRRSAPEISKVSRNLVLRARAGLLTPDDLAGGTFTVTNLGMFGVTRFTPIINPPQAAILAVGAVRSGVTDPGSGGTADRASSVLTLVCDHRVVYGAPAATFLARVCALIAAPRQLI